MSDLRMPEINQVTLAGRLTKDLNFGYTKNGRDFAKIFLACSRSYKTKDTKERKEEVLFVNVLVYDATAEYCNENLKKGNPILVEGKLITDQWIDDYGQKKQAIEVSAHRIQPLSWDNSQDK